MSNVEFLGNVDFLDVLGGEFRAFSDPGNVHTLGRLGLDALRNSLLLTSETEVLYTPPWAPVEATAKVHPVGTNSMVLHGISIVDNTTEERDLDPNFSGQLEIKDKSGLVRVKLRIGAEERDETVPMGTETEIRKARLLVTGAAQIFFGGRLSHLM
jgi:hypothetical protein